MTFNATSPSILAAKAAGLVAHVPLQRIENPARCILCSPLVDQQLSGMDPKCGLPSIGVAQIVGWFIAGYSLTVSQQKRPSTWRGPKPELERLDGFDEVWVLCYRKPKPGWRILGRFLEKDVLVLSRVKDKLEIGSDYGVAAAEVVSDWGQYFGQLLPCKGLWISGYLSGTHYDVDTKTQI